MDYKVAFYILLTVVIVYCFCNVSVYIGSDRAKYEKATIGILMKEDYK